MATWKITPDTGEVVGGAHSDMPLVLIPSDTEIGALTLAEAESIRCYTDSGLTTEIAREVVSADEIHIKVPSVSSSTEIWVDFDGVRSDYATTATYGAENVWTDYSGVVHFNESSGTAALNSTGGSNGTHTASGVNVGATGKIGRAVDYLGTSGADTRFGNLVSLGTNDFSISMWVQLDSVVDNNMFIYNKANSGAVNNRIFMRTLSGSVSIFTQDSSTFTNLTHPTSISTATWYHVVATRTGTSGVIYLNANGSSGTVPGGNVGGSTPWQTGNLTTTFPMNGRLDGVKIRPSLLSADWITTEYNNQVDNGAFWVATEVGGGGGATFTPIVSMIS